MRPQPSPDQAASTAAEVAAVRADEAPRFSWEAIESSHHRGYWKLGWDLVSIQWAAIRRAVPEVSEHRTVGATYAPLADLEISQFTASLEYLDADPAAYPGCREIYRPADDASKERIPAGTQMVLRAELYDRYHEGMGANVWRASDQRYFATALEGRWGCAAVFTDALIVPADASVLGDTRAREDLLAELRAITSDYRRRHGLVLVATMDPSMTPPS